MSHHDDHHDKKHNMKDKNTKNDFNIAQLLCVIHLSLTNQDKAGTKSLGWLKPGLCVRLHQQKDEAQPLLFTFTITLYSMSTTSDATQHSPLVLQECPPINPIGSGQNY